MHGLLDEFCRAGELRPGKLHQFQREFRDQIQPLLDERERLLEENAALRAQLEAQPAKPRAGKPVEVPA